MSKSIEIGDLEVSPTAIDEHPETESVKIHGPPGSGKTTQATARVAMLLRDHDYSISDVAWLTYRKSLARDTIRRLVAADVVADEALANPTEGATKFIGTAHAVANRASPMGAEPVGWKDKFDFCQNIGLKFKKSNPWEQTPGEQLFRIFTYARKNLLDPSDRDDLALIPEYREFRKDHNINVPRTYRRWLDWKEEHGKIMFWEMLAGPLRENVQLGRDILVVDEYHDVYPLLAKLAEYWMQDAEIVVVPGDPHQVINNFDGADPDFYHRLPYPEISLPTAWERPPYEHWTVARKVLEKAHTPPEMTIRNRGAFRVQRSPSFVLDDLGQWSVPAPDKEHSPAWFIEEHGADTMFLARTNRQLDGIAKALEKDGVLYQTPRSSDVADWSAPPNDRMSDRAAIYNALQKLSKVSTETFDGSYGLDSYGDETGRAPEKVVLRPQEAATLIDHTQSKHLSFTRDQATQQATEWLRAEEPVTAATLGKYVGGEFWQMYTRGENSVGYLNKTGKATKSTFDGRELRAVRKALAKNKYPIEGRPDVRVYTIHASKGNQADTVVVWDGVTRRIKQSARENEEDEKNEWRTWYVALTRSTNALYVLKGGFDFTYSWLPRGKQLLSAAQRGYDHAESEGVEA